DVRKKEPCRGLGKGEVFLAAREGIAVIVVIIATVARFATLDTRAGLCRELGLIDLLAELGGVANRIVVHERQPGHPGDGGGVVSLQRSTKFRDEVIEFLLQRWRGDGFLGRRLDEGGSNINESGCEQNSQQNLHFFNSAHLTNASLSCSARTVSRKS